MPQDVRTPGYRYIWQMLSMWPYYLYLSECRYTHTINSQRRSIFFHLSMNLRIQWRYLSLSSITEVIRIIIRYIQSTRFSWVTQLKCLAQSRVHGLTLMYIRRSLPHADGTFLQLQMNLRLSKLFSLN